MMALDTRATVCSDTFTGDFGWLSALGRICTTGTRIFDVYHYLSIKGKGILTGWATISLYIRTRLVKCCRK